MKGTVITLSDHIHTAFKGSGLKVSTAVAPGNTADVFYCSANSPDLNPTENEWAIVKKKMRDTRPNNVDELKAAIKATWAFVRP